MANLCLRQPPTEFLVWSYEHNAWWNPGWCGYTGDYREAGTYSLAQAEMIVDRSFGMEVMLPKDAVFAAMKKEKQSHS